MPSLIVVRHGNTFDAGETVTRVGRRTDLPLSQSGAAQAERLGAHFREGGIIFTQLLAAPLKRTHQTAAAIAAATKTTLAIQSDPMLLEIDYGPDENQPETSVIARIGKDAMRRWNEDAVPPPDWDVDPPTIVAGWQSLFARVRALGPKDSVLAVTSNGVARFALDAADKTPAAAPRKLRTGAYGRIDIDQDRAVVSSWDVRP